METILIGVFAGAMTFTGLLICRSLWPGKNPLEAELDAERKAAFVDRARLEAAMKRERECSDAAEQAQLAKEVVETELELSQERAASLADALATVHALANRIHTITTPFGISNARRKPVMSEGYEGAD